MNDITRHFATVSCGVAVLCTLFAGSPSLHGQLSEHQQRTAAVSDWSHHHLLYTETDDAGVLALIQKDPRWSQNRLQRHPETWWPERRTPSRKSKAVDRDWNTSLGTVGFAPQFDASFSFSINGDVGYGTWSTTAQANNGFLTTAGSLTVTATSDGNSLGVYTVYPGGPTPITSPNGGFQYDNLLYPASNPVLSVVGGPLFINSSGFEINLWGNTPADNYSFYGSAAASGSTYPYQATGTPFNLTMSTTPDPGGAQTFPAKFEFNVTAAPSCANDYVAIGLPASGAAGGQANIIGWNNLYTNAAGTGYCTGSGPTVKFAYASGSGQVPAAISLSADGTQLVYVEDTPPSAYFHVLTLGTTGTNGTGPTAAVAPGAAGGNNAVDSRVLLSPNGGTTTQSCTTSAFVNYVGNAAYVTTYSTSGAGSGYLYKIGNVFGGGSPAIVWSVAIDAVPSSPVYDSVSNKVFFTDTKGRIDSVTDIASPSVVYGTVVAAGATSTNSVTVDSTNQKVYATFNSNGTNALVVQSPTSLASSISVPVGKGETTNTGPYGVDFNNAFYSGTGTPLLFVAGTGTTGTLPTLYSVGFNRLNLSASKVTSTALATGTADSSPVTEFYNAALGQDLLFAGVSDNCSATTGGGTGGCIMSLNITNGFPAVTAETTALAAAGGPTGMVIDNDSSDAQASSVYYATKTGATLVKATQSGLN